VLPACAGAVVVVDLVVESSSEFVSAVDDVVEVVAVVDDLDELVADVFAEDVDAAAMHPVRTSMPPTLAAPESRRARRAGCGLGRCFMTPPSSNRSSIRDRSKGRLGGGEEPIKKNRPGFLIGSYRTPTPSLSGSPILRACTTRNRARTVMTRRF
jgi:hypothetical protein